MTAGNRGWWRPGPRALIILAMTASLTAAAHAQTLRVVTWNVSMGLDAPGALGERLARQDDPALLAMTSVLQLLRPDLLLLNEFDFDPDVDAAGLLNANYLDVPRDDGRALGLAHSFRDAVNTGVDSGLDLDGNGQTGDPADAWGFGRFPGQYGMLVLSRWPIDADRARTFRLLPWSAMPGALRPVNPDGTAFHPDATWAALRLSSKSHWDVPVSLPDGRSLHLLASHPTPPAFDGPEDRNGRRNHDEIRFWADYVESPVPAYIRDDRGVAGGPGPDALFVIAGDLNADPDDGGSWPGAIEQLLEHPAVQAQCVPSSRGGPRAALDQGGANPEHRGDPAHDTADFSDRQVGNLRVDYVLPSRGLEVVSCGVFWPGPGEPLADRLDFTDHRPVWLDIRIPGAPDGQN